MKYRLLKRTGILSLAVLTVLLSLAAAGCAAREKEETPTQEEASSTRVEDTTAVEADTTAVEADTTAQEADTTTQEVAVPAVPATLSISLLSDEAEQALPAHTTVEGAIDEYVVRMLLRTDGPVRDFTVFRVAISYEGEMTVGETLYHRDAWAAGEDLVLTASFPGVYPPIGLSYTDTTGAQHTLHVVMSGRDGSISLMDA